MSIVSYPVGLADSAERWRVVEDHPAMIAAVTDLLDHPAGSASLLPLTMATTVAAYDRLFRSPPAR
jgi:hypothetical protein